MLRFDSYYYKDEDAPRMLLSLDWFKYEDHWSQRYMFDRAMYPEDMMERMKERNAARCEWFKLTLNIMHYKISIEIKLKHIGNVYHGRVMKDEPDVPAFVRRNREKEGTGRKQMILFVASNPSHLNEDPQVPFVGSKSEKTFNEWVNFLAPDKKFAIVNVSDMVTENNRPLKKAEYDLLKLSNYAIHPSVKKVIALGNTASDALDMIGIKYFKLPHPSPLNRFLNNAVQVEAILRRSASHG